MLDVEGIASSGVVHYLHLTFSLLSFYTCLILWTARPSFFRLAFELAKVFLGLQHVPLSQIHRSLLKAARARCLVFCVY